MQGSAQDVSYHLEELSKSLVSDFKTEKGRKGVGKKERLYSLLWSLPAPVVIQSRWGVPPGDPGGTLESPVLSGSCSWVGPIWGARNDAVKKRSWRLYSQKIITQVFFIKAPGTQGISPPNVHAKHPVISG